MSEMNNSVYICTCKGTEELGNYKANCVDVLLPFVSAREPLRMPDGSLRWVVPIDRCMLREVTDLWRAGIRTTESCCGHRKAAGYVGFWKEDEEKAEALGYKRYAERPHVFHSKTQPLHKLTEVWAERTGLVAELERMREQNKTHPIHMTSEAYKLLADMAQELVSSRRDICWHCQVCLAQDGPRPRCTECPDECDIEGCAEPGCTGTPPRSDDLSRRIETLRSVGHQLERTAAVLGEDRGVLDFDQLECEVIAVKLETQRVLARFLAYAQELRPNAVKTEKQE